MYNSNMEEMEEYVPRQEHRDKDERINGLKEENKELKKRVNKLSIEMKVNDKASQETIDKLYNLKHEESKFMQLLLDSKKDKKKSMIT